jgi:hypothetical protein
VESADAAALLVRCEALVAQAFRAPQDLCREQKQSFSVTIDSWTRSSQRVAFSG